MTVVAGDEVEYRTWNGTGWDSHFAMVRTAPASPHASLNLFWGDAGTQVNNVENIENWATEALLEGNDHWRMVEEPFPYHLLAYPKTTKEVFIGSIITFRQYDSGESEFFPFNAVVQAVQGGPGQAHATVNLTWYDSAGKHNENGVEPAEDLNAASGGAGWNDTDHWITHPTHDGDVTE